MDAKPAYGYWLRPGEVETFLNQTQVWRNVSNQSIDVENITSDYRHRGRLSSVAQIRLAIEGKYRSQYETMTPTSPPPHSASRPAVGGCRLRLQIPEGSRRPV